MRTKISLVIAGVALGVFAMGRTDGLTGKGWSGPVAFAQESDDQSVSQADSTPEANAAQESDDQAGGAVSQEPASTGESADAPDVTAVSAGGIYSGTVMDENEGAGTISAALSQIKKKLIGTWQDSFVPPAFFNGKIQSNGKINAKMRFHIKGNCGYKFVGTFTNGDEISGEYTLFDCKGMPADSGTLDMTKD